jgi:hypothetical protein
VGFGSGAGVSHRTLFRVADDLGVFPQCSRLVVVAAGSPGAASLRQLGLAQGNVDRAGGGVDRDYVAVANQSDRPAYRDKVMLQGAASFQVVATPTSGWLIWFSVSPIA